MGIRRRGRRRLRRGEEGKRRRLRRGEGEKEKTEKGRRGKGIRLPKTTAGFQAFTNNSLNAIMYTDV